MTNEQKKELEDLITQFGTAYAEFYATDDNAELEAKRCVNAMRVRESIMDFVDHLLNRSAN